MKSYVQFGEDVNLHRLLTSGAPGLHADGVYVEVGGNALLFEELGYRCVVVEPIPYLARRIREHRRCIVVEAATDRTNRRARFLVARGGDTLSTLDNENRIRSRIDEHPHLEKIEVVTKTLDSSSRAPIAGTADQTTLS